MDRKKELLAERNAINTYIKNTQEQHHQAFVTWVKMEGKYGKKVYDDIVFAHDRGYHYEYTTPADEAKEKQERDEYWKTHRIYENEFKFFAPERARLAEIENELCLIKYGMTTEERDLRRHVKSALQHIEEAEAELIDAQDKYKEWQAKLDAYLANKVDA